MDARRDARRQRISYGKGKLGGHSLIPEVLQAGWGRFAVAEPNHLTPHRHNRAFEFCLIVSGEVEWATPDRSFVLRAGDIFLTQPNETHWGRDSAMQPCTLFWLHLAADPDQDFWSSFPDGLGDTLLSRLRLVPRQLRGEGGKVMPLFKAIFDEHRAPVEGAWGSGLREASARAALQQLVIEVVRASEAAPHEMNADDVTPPLVEHAIAIIRAAAVEKLSAREIAKRVGSSPDHLNALFISAIGMSITQFSLRERIRVARTMLRETELSVTEIANDLGFSSSQHFATTFRHITGISPTRCRSENAASRVRAPH